MAYEVVMPYHLHMPSYFLETFTEYPYLKKTSTVVSYEAGMMDYNKKYNESRRLAMKNINNAMACSDDYLMVARSIMKLSNSKESNAECLEYLNKADETSKITNVNIC